MKNILFICGGESAEHEISIISARNVIAALDKTQYNPIVVAISRSGSWYYLADVMTLDTLGEYTDEGVAPLCTLLRTPTNTSLLTTDNSQIIIDAAFPLVHGSMGEDGTLQGFLEMMGLPTVGCGVLSSAMGMDKDVSKKMFAAANIACVPNITLYTPEEAPSYQEVCQRLNSTTLFVKPAVTGSSVGILKITQESQYLPAITHAFRYGTKILIEKHISGREIECSVLGNQHPMASCVGEIKTRHDFYSYEAKYLDPNGAELIIPADLPTPLAEKVRALAVKAYRSCDCRGFARVDFFLADDGTLYVNEINTIPGFTSISMYPKLWEASGITYSALISQLIAFAFEAFETKRNILLTPEKAPVAPVAVSALA